MAKATNKKQTVDLSVDRTPEEKKKALAHEANSLKSDIKSFLGIKGIEDVRIINRYDAENMEESLFNYAVNTVFSEPQLDIATPDYTTEVGDTVVVMSKRSGLKDVNDILEG